MKTISPLEIAALADDGQPVEILDIRSRAQFDRAHIEGSHWLTTTDITPEAILLERELSPTAPLYLVSESGALAQLAAIKLEREGSDNVVVLSGGLRAWQHASLPVTEEQSLPRTAYHA